MSEQTQDNVPAEPNTHRYHLPLFHRHEREVDDHHPWPDGPAGVKDGEYFSPPYDGYFCKGFCSEPVGPHEENAEEAEHANCLVEDQLGNHTGPSDPRARGLEDLQKLGRGSLGTQPALLIVVLLLRLRWRGCLSWEGGPTRKQPFEEDVPAVAELGLEEAVYGKLYDALAVDGLGDGVL